MTDETATHEADAPESAHEDVKATALAEPVPVAIPAPIAAREWFDLSGPLTPGRHYEGLTGQWFTTTGTEKRQVRFARGVDVSAITDAASALAAVAKAGRGKITFRYEA